MRAVLHLADRHLDGEHREHDERAAKVTAATDARARASEDRERDAEDGGRAHVPVDRGLERPEPADDGAARMRAGGRRKRPADQQDAGGERDEQPEDAHPFRHDAERARPHLERQHDAEREHDDREQEVREHEPRVQVRVHRERAERRLRERAEEDHECEPAKLAHDRDEPGARPR